MTDHNNPYSPPESAVIETVTTNVTSASTHAISRPPIAGVKWIRSAFDLFKPHAFLWIVLFVIFGFICIVMAIFQLAVPLIGSVAMFVATPILTYGVISCAYDQDTRGGFELGTLFSGFSEKTSQLLVAGALFTGLMFLSFLPLVIAGGELFLSAASGSVSIHQLIGLGTKMKLGVLFSLALTLPAIMAYWFAPALIKFHNMNPLQAYKISFLACLKNVVPYLFYGIVMAILIAISAIPLGLGLLITLPISMISMYTSYKDIFSG